jgi:hypothetical protein
VADIRPRVPPGDDDLVITAGELGEDDLHGQEALQSRSTGAVEITCVTLDCADPANLAQFWSEALRWPKVRVGDDNSGAVVLPPERGTYLELVQVPEDKLVKNRMHLGCTAGTLDELDNEIARLVALGASIGWEEQFEDDVAARYRNLVLRDPEGNEFCLSGGSWRD